MPLNADVLVKEASGLPYAERAKLVDALLTTLDPIIEDDCDIAWFAEIARRESNPLQMVTHKFIPGMTSNVRFVRE